MSSKLLQSVSTPSRRAVLRGALGVSAGGALALRGLRLGPTTTAAQDASPAAGTGLDAYPEVVYSGFDYGYDGPAEFQSGLTRITLTNDGMMDHHAMLVQLNEGMSIDDLPGAMEQGLPGLFSLGTAVGGPGSISPGQTTTALHDVAPGNYLMMCLIPDEDGIPHVAKGMVIPITVTQGAEAATYPAPEPDGTIELMDFHFSGLPETVPAGQYLWAVNNTGQQLHEIVIFKNAPGVTYEQVMAIFGAEGGGEATPMAEAEGMESTPMAVGSPEAAGGPPFTAITGWAPAAPGTGAYFVADLEPGEHFAICFIPDPETGAPHFALGMIQRLTVT